MVETETEFLVEVTNRTKADVKVGIAYIRSPLQCAQLSFYQGGTLIGKFMVN